MAGPWFAIVCANFWKRVEFHVCFYYTTRVFIHKKYKEPCTSTIAVTTTTDTVLLFRSVWRRLELSKTMFAMYACLNLILKEMLYQQTYPSIWKSAIESSLSIKLWKTLTIRQKEVVSQRSQFAWYKAVDDTEWAQINLLTIRWRQYYPDNRQILWHLLRQ